MCLIHSRINSQQLNGNVSFTPIRVRVKLRKRLIDFKRGKINEFALIQRIREKFNLCQRKINQRKPFHSNKIQNHKLISHIQRKTLTRQRQKRYRRIVSQQNINPNPETDFERQKKRKHKSWKVLLKRE
jgi:hypothetical protein